MDTHYALAERVSADDLKEEIALITKNSVIDGLLNSVSGLLAVLNEHRQILSLNTLLLEMLGVGDPGKVFGLRLGEALHCIHSAEMPGGCGTSKSCSTCGAAISIVSTLATDTPKEMNCALVTEKLGRKQDLYFRVRCVPIKYRTKRFLLLFMQDITYFQSLAALERVFFHDINSIIQGLVCASDLIELSAKDNESRELAQAINRLTMRLCSEVEAQRCLNRNEIHTHQPTFSFVPATQVIQELSDIFSKHPAAKNKNFVLPANMPRLYLKTEPSLLLRVLSNMVLNAFEETEDGGEVRMDFKSSDSVVTFSIWNRKVIPKDVAMRIFQRNFSTKPGSGRGLGTYSMKLFGEEILGGKVSFTTSEPEGTIFSFTIKT